MPELSQLVVDGPALYLIVAGLVMLDAVFPLAPSETLLVTGGVLVSAGDVLFVPLVIAGAAGALLGHVLLFIVGSRAGPGVVKRLVRGASGEKRVSKAKRQLERRPWLLVLADFVPWGRSILMFSAGALGLAAKRFLVFASAGALIWAVFFAGLGLAGGSLFESTWHSLAASIAAVLAITVLLELIQRRRRDA